MGVKKLPKFLNFQNKTCGRLTCSAVLANSSRLIHRDARSLGTRPQTKAQVLIVVIILIAFTTILVATTTIFLAQALNLGIVKVSQAQAIDAAGAGIYKAIVDYRNNGAWTAETDTQITGNIYYSIGDEDSTFLQVDASNPTLYGNNRKLKDITIYNLNSADNITINTLTISWSPDNGEALTRINFADGSVEWTGSASSGQSIPLTYTFTAGNDYSFKLIWAVGNNMSTKTITAQFGFTDGSSRNVNLLVSGSAGSNDFLIKSTGKVVAKDTWKRTIVATYDVGTEEITLWQESSSHL